MRMTCFLLLLLTLMSVSARQPVQPKPQPPYAFTHVTVIDVISGTAKPNSTVVISGDRISAVGETGKVRIPAGARVIEAAGKFLIPGLWDMHVHFWNAPSLLPLFVANGVTGVRDMGGEPRRVLKWREEISRGSVVGPRIFTAGQPVDGQAVQLPPLELDAVIAKDAASGRAAVIAAKQSGADFVKILSGLSREAYFAIAEEASKQKIDFAGHLPNSIHPAEAADAGQKSIEHFFGFALACSSREAQLREARLAAIKQRDGAAYWKLGDQIYDSYDAEKAAAIYARLIKNGTWVTPTLAYYKRDAFAYEAPDRDPQLRYIPSAIKREWKNPVEQMKALPAATLAGQKRNYQEAIKLAGAMQRAGVSLLAGTDMGDDYTFPGSTLHDELALLVEAGLTPAAALRTATSNPAKYFGLFDSLGTIAPGKIADLVLLDANPLVEISNTRKIAAVVAGGKLHSNAALREILTAVEAAGRK